MLARWAGELEGRREVEDPGPDPVGEVLHPDPVHRPGGARDEVGGSSAVTRTVAVLHPGQMGAAVAAQARQRGARVLWYPVGRSPATAERADKAGLTPVNDLADLLHEVEAVLSICPPAFADDVAAAVREHGYRGIYVEANAISPQRSTRILESLTSAGMTVVDGAIIGPPPAGSATARLYLAGDPDAAANISVLFTGTLVQAIRLEQDPPAASALKMAYAGYQKASRALAAVAHSLADHYDVTGPLLKEAQRIGTSPLADPDYLPSVAARAWRWAPELRDVADTLREARLPPELAEAAATTLDRWEHRKDETPSLTETLGDLKAPPRS